MTNNILPAVCDETNASMLLYSTQSVTTCWLMIDNRLIIVT